jgi:hypothetical protein
MIFRIEESNMIYKNTAILYDLKNLYFNDKNNIILKDSSSIQVYLFSIYTQINKIKLTRLQNYFLCYIVIWTV